MKPKSWLLKLIMGIALLTYLILFVSLKDIMLVIKNTNILLLAALFLFVPLLYLIRGHKWKLLLDEINVKIKFWQACKIVLMGTFYGILTPAKSGELTRIYFLSEAKSKTLPTVLLDKIIDLFALIFLSLLSIILLFANKLLLTIIIFALILGFILLTSITSKTLFLYLVDIFSFPNETAELYFESVERLMRNKKKLFKVFIWSIIYYFACIALGMGVLIALDPKLPLTLAFSLPLIILFGNAPITVSGLGLRESASIFAFIMLGAPASQGLLFAFVLFLLITLFPGIIGFLLNISLKQELIGLKNIPGNYYNKHVSKNPIVRFMMVKFHTDLEELFLKTNVKKVLDVGCGEGYTTNYLKSRHKEISICGIDLEESIIKIAKQLHPHIDFYIGDICKLNFRDKSFDMIITNEVLEHLENPEDGLKEVKRIAKQYCIISVPNEPFFRIANICRLKYIGDLGNTHGHIQNFTKKQFKQLLSKQFSEVEIKTSTLWNIALCKI